MKRTILSGLLGGLSVLIFIIIFTNLFGVDPFTFYESLVKDTFFKKYHLDLVFIILITLSMILVYKKSMKK